MPPSASLSVIIPCLNEATNLPNTVASVQAVAPRYFAKLQFIFINDGSTDGTGPLIDRLAAQSPDAVALHHAQPRNLGACYREGLSVATGEYVILIPGDNECSQGVMERVFDLAGQADIIVPFTENQDIRGWWRKTLSQAFVRLLNLLSGERLRYYNGSVLHRTSLARATPFSTNGFGYQAELLVKLLRQGCTYREVGTRISPRLGGGSKAFKAKNVLQTLYFLATFRQKCLN